MKKTVLITGTSSGLGKACAKVFVKNGWNVVATMRRPDREEELTKLREELVPRLDVEDPLTIRRAIEPGIDRFRRIDVLINNAGVGLYTPFEVPARGKVHAPSSFNVFGLIRVR